MKGVLPMGLIKAIKGAAGGFMADMWRESFYCESLSPEVLVTKGGKMANGKRSSNTKGTDNIISNGSIVIVNEGQFMIIVDQGKIVEFSGEPGEFLYDTSTQPTLLFGSFGENIKNSFMEVGKRFTFGGEPAKDQRVYYFNMKEIIDNKFGSPNPIPYRVVDQRANIDIDISLRVHGNYSYKIVDPIMFYTNVCGNVTEEYTRDMIDNQLKMEFIDIFADALADVSAIGVRYSLLRQHTKEIKEAVNRQLTESWVQKRGLAISSIAIGGAVATAEDEAMLKELQKMATYTNPAMAAATLVGAQADAMRDAANNQGGAMMGFAGLNMAQGAGGFNAQSLYNMAAQQPMQQQPIGYGSGQPQQAPKQEEIRDAAPKQETGWTCTCGHQGNEGKFCMECGKSKPVEVPKDPYSWTCSCGHVNKGKFCAECGAKKPPEAVVYRCDKCGWEPADKTNPPKFCPECGDRFDEDDIQA